VAEAPSHGQKKSMRDKWQMYFAVSALFGLPLLLTVFIFPQFTVTDAPLMHPRTDRAGRPSTVIPSTWQLPNTSLTAPAHSPCPPKVFVV